MPGKNFVILGSGDIGLIMARRLTFEGAKVHCIAEIQPKSGGLQRNIAQCVEDFDIPLLLSHTVVKIHGKERLEGVTIAEVDKGFKPCLLYTSTAKNIEYVFDDSGAYPHIVGVQIIEDKISYTNSLYIYKDSKFQKCIYESYEYNVNAPQDVGAAKPLRVIYTTANDIENGKEASVRAQMQNALKLELLNNYKVEHISCEVLQDLSLIHI